jgi:hypothetical protein
MTNRTTALRPTDGVDPREAASHILACAANGELDGCIVVRIHGGNLSVCRYGELTREDLLLASAILHADATRDL